MNKPLLSRLIILTGIVFTAGLLLLISTNFSNDALATVLETFVLMITLTSIIAHFILKK